MCDLMGRGAMTSVLITAFEPYDRWQANSSWLTLVQSDAKPARASRPSPRGSIRSISPRSRKSWPATCEPTTTMPCTLGQAPGSTRIQLESIAINVGGSSTQSPDQFRPLVDGRSDRLSQPAAAGRLGGATASRRHSGASLVSRRHVPVQRDACTSRATWPSEWARRPKAAFIHLPLDPSQTAEQARTWRRCRQRHVGRRAANDPGRMLA